jgi:hypothetical protein
MPLTEMWMNIVNPVDEHNELDARAKTRLSFASNPCRTKGELKMIPFKLDHVIEATLAGGAIEEQKVLKELAGVRLTPAEARAEWTRVLEHKWFVSERVGRDVGLRVAALDYFENVRLPRHTRTSRKPAASRLGRAAQAHSLIA